jgi:hypothetical protein
LLDFAQEPCKQPTFTTYKNSNKANEINSVKLGDTTQNSKKTEGADLGGDYLNQPSQLSYEPANIESMDYANKKNK